MIVTDADFIAKSRELVPRLLDEVEGLRSVLNEISKVYIIGTGSSAFTDLHKMYQLAQKALKPTP